MGQPQQEPQGQRAETCAKCGKPRATAADLIRRRSGARPRGGVCWVGLGGEALLLPGEETADAETLRQLLIEARRVFYLYGCAVEEWARGR